MPLKVECPVLAASRHSCSRYLRLNVPRIRPLYKLRLKLWHLLRHWCGGLRSLNCAALRLHPFGVDQSPTWSTTPRSLGGWPRLTGLKKLSTSDPFHMAVPGTSCFVELGPVPSWCPLNIPPLNQHPYAWKNLSKKGSRLVSLSDEPAK